MLRSLLPFLTVLICLCACDKRPLDAPSSALESTPCQVGTPCKVGENRYEVALHDVYHDGRDSPMLRARAESAAQRRCRREKRGMLPLTVSLEGDFARPGGLIRLQFACSGSMPASLTSTEQRVADDDARRDAALRSRVACSQGTICTLNSGRMEVAALDDYKDGKDSPLFLARVNAAAQRTCGIEHKGVQVLDVRLESAAVGSEQWIMRLQFVCSGPMPTSPTAAERLVAADATRRASEREVAQHLRDMELQRLMAQRAADPAHQKELALQSIRRSVKYRFVVSFNSWGSGPNPADGASFRAVLDEQQRIFGRVFKYTESAWGREGESSLCFPLDELDVGAQRKFVAAFTSKFRTRTASLGEHTQCPGRPYSESEEAQKIMCARNKTYC